MQSIQTKIVLLIMAVIIVASSVIGGVGIYGFDKAAREDSIDIINTSCGEKAQELNMILERIEHSIETMSYYAVENIKSVDEFVRSPNFVESYTQNLAKIGMAMANETEGAVAVYMRFNPTLVGERKGYFKVYSRELGVFRDYELTVITDYKFDDIGHAGWYYIPVKSGKPTWMEPYHNDNTDMDVISYIIPFYKSGRLIGIVGMDIDYNYIKEKVDDITMYETGHALLTKSDLSIAYDREAETGTSLHELGGELSSASQTDIVDSDRIFEYRYEGVRRKLSVKSLRNGMCLAVTVPVSEINENARAFIKKSVIVLILVLAAFVGISIAVTGTIVRPLRELNAAAQQVAEGNLDVNLSCRSRDEVGMLTRNFGITVGQLRKQITYINGLAYTDKLTGISNNTSYLQRVAETKEKMKDTDFRFSVFVIDINGLKHINDNYGHSCGNELIIAASKAVARVFGYENSYRIGGDEFAVIMEGADSDRCNNYKNEFYNAISEKAGSVVVCAAIGSAVSYGAEGETYESIFERADSEMYRIKEKMKSEGKNSSVTEG